MFFLVILQVELSELVSFLLCDTNDFSNNYRYGQSLGEKIESFVAFREEIPRFTIAIHGENKLNCEENSF